MSARSATPHRRTPLRRWLRRAAERRAATAVMFALTITPLLGFVALAFDVGSAVWAQSQLDLAADAAALSAVTAGANAAAIDPGASLQPAQLAGVKRFDAQANQMPGVAVAARSVGVSRNGNAIVAVANYTANYRTQFAGIFGYPTLALAGAATASRTDSPFFDIEFLLDISSSMAIAASQDDMKTLGKLVRNSKHFKDRGQNQDCAFGCHFAADDDEDFYKLAKSNGVPLRVDVLGQAVQSVIQTIKAAPAAPQFKVGLYGFNAAFTTIYPASGDLAGAINAAGNLTLPVSPNGADADTNIPLALRSVAAALPPSGDGSTANSPRRYLFIVTDGVGDYYDAGGNRIIAPLDPAQCAALKAKGVQVLTLYTRYVPLVPPYVATANGFYLANVAPFVDRLFPNLQACASSPDFAFEASDPASINTALQAMLQAALSRPARFTQ